MSSAVPAHLRYTRDHEWLDGDGVATVGITAFAADALGDIVYLELPEPGRTVAAGEPCGEIESTKSVSELYAPVDGEIVAVNEAAATEPGLLNNDPYGQGWLFRLRLTGTPELLDAAAYAAFTGEAA
ncbi:glycine cleavage system protein GcvH [Catellatospora bangladeshensis]|uniref:Glycine cleavage system H protein n=1 Tax=Catellatospora bangladeshensis TaxID=310355 RepID=A0A8J3NEP3_9ACTN|nr:glycine cleavage system protein GcvH [Catellatospora bangladeshensis]GIF78745.1 glycine cleavage system H protein [Catellatospora bangladeshensis]